MKFLFCIIAVIICATQLSCRSKERVPHHHDVFALPFMAFQIRAEKSEKAIDEIHAVIGHKEWSMQSLGPADDGGRIGPGDIIMPEDQISYLFTFAEELTDEERKNIKDKLSKLGASGPFFTASPEGGD